jgi:hypothetical protein
MMKHAIAYKRRDGWYLHSSSETADGVWVATQPFLKLAAEATLRDIGDAVLAALDASRQNVAHPKEWNGIFKPMLDLAGVKSWSTFMQGSLCLRIEASEGILAITPTKNLGPKEGHLPFDDKVVRLPDSKQPDAIGTGMQSAISHCK